MGANLFQSVMSASKLSVLGTHGSADMPCQMICGGDASILYFGLPTLRMSSASLWLVLSP